MDDKFYNDILELADLNNPYQANYFYAHLFQLEKVFVSVRTILGHNNFKYFASQFIKEIHSDAENMDFYGWDFPKFLASRVELSQMPYLRELALIDYYWFNLGQRNKDISVVCGALNLWSKVINSEDTEGVELNADHSEIVELYLEGEQYFLRASRGACK